MLQVPYGFVIALLLGADRAEQLQQIELRRLGVQQCAIGVFGFAQTALLMQGKRLLKGAGGRHEAAYSCAVVRIGGKCTLGRR